MRYKYLLLLLMTVVLFSCKKERTIYSPPAQLPPAPAVLLKDIVIPNLPSPYYHFEYDTTRRPIFVSFASDLTRYEIVYSGDTIKEMRNNILVNKDTLRYSYDNTGRVTLLSYINGAGVIYTRIFFTYDGQKLIELQREKRVGPDFIIDKKMSFAYDPDGNLREVSDHRPPLNGQPALTFTDRYEQYDTKVNVDGFSLLHNEFFDHLVFLPGVRLQKNNPGKLVHTGDGVNYQVTYTYTYNDRNAPLTKAGAGVWLSGPNMGQPFPSNSIFSYY